MFQLAALRQAAVPLFRTPAMRSFATAAPFVARATVPKTASINMAAVRNMSRGVARGAGVARGGSMTMEAAKPNYLLGGLAAAGVAALGFIGASMASTAVSGATSVGSHSVWSPIQRERVQKTFLAFGVGVAATGVTSVLLFRMGAAHRLAGLGFLGTIAFVGVSIGTSMVVRSIPPHNTVAKFSALMLFNTTIGLMISPLMVLGGPLLARAAAMTAAIVGSLSFVAANSPSEQYMWMAGPLAMGLGVVFISSFAGFLPGGAIANAMHKVWMYGGLALFSALALFDASRIVDRAGKMAVYDPVNESLSIYMDAVNLFIRLAMIMGGNNNRRK